ncbi:MAG: hypothetical protein ACRBFS_22080 [Aureispira sp.]
MNRSFTIFYLWTGVSFFCCSPLLQAQKCGKTTETTTATTIAVVENKQAPKRIFLPPKYQPLVSEQTKIPSRNSKLNQKRRQNFWKRQQRSKRKGCPATRF